MNAAASAADLPSRIGEHRILSWLGGGASGVVYLAHDDRLDRQVAIKVLRPGLATHRVARERFAREIRLLGSLRHPGLVPLLDAGEWNDTLYLVMEAVEGGPLSRSIRELRRSGLSPDQLTAAQREAAGVPSTGPWRDTAISLVLDTAHAIAHAHEQGIVHRDLKPSNIMITRRGNARVVDLGVARGTDDDTLTQSGEWVGSPQYLAPEQGRGEAADARSDVYSLGGLLYELLTLKPPTREALIVADEPILTWIIERARHPDPDQRNTDAREFAEELENALQRRPLRHPPPGWLARALGAGRRHAVALAAILAVVAILTWAVAHTAPLAHRARVAERLSQEAYTTEAGLLERGRAMVLQQRERQQNIGRFVERAAVEALLDQETTLYPRVPSLIPAFERWLIEVESLQARDDPAFLDACRRIDALVQTHRQQSWIAPTASEPDWTRLSVSDAWTLREWYRLRQGLDQLQRLAGDVRGRLAWARTIERRSVGAYTTEWAEARHAVETHALYNGLPLEPQMGLVPLGPDPASTLWEFWDLATGERPERTPDGTAWDMKAETGLVFVLLPPGGDRIGLPPSWLSEPANRRPVAALDMDFVHDVDGGCRLLSKYEMTRGQWTRAVQSSTWLGSVEIECSDGRLPAAGMDWFRAESVLRHLGLWLPHGYVWEYAARAGTDEPWYTGAEPHRLIGHENLSSLFWNTRDRIRSEGDHTWPDDGANGLAPVGLYRANPWGLHDVLGNVAEWTWERPKMRRLEETEWAQSRYRYLRGGHFGVGVLEAHVAMRQSVLGASQLRFVGVRPLRKLDPFQATHPPEEKRQWVRGWRPTGQCP